MGSFVFTWTHPAEEVYVTGTFDDWSKSEKLVKTGEVFTKNVTLKSADEKIYYKFVVDGNWVTDHTAPQENDLSGNLNNVLTTDRIVKHTPETAGIMSGVGPTSTTADLAGKVPLEKTGSSELPGAFPETPALESGEFSVNPLPATDGASNPVKLAPGETVPHPTSFTGNTITSGVHDDPELVAADKAKSESESEPTFGVAPLPAFPGAVNPVKSVPGEEVPHHSSLTQNTIHSGVHTDKESYEKAGGLGDAPVLPAVVTPQAEREANGTGILGLPSIAKNLIPESSLPMGDADKSLDASPFVQSTGATSTTAKLAGDVPLESSKVPEVVKESQKEAGFEPEASAIPEEVTEKSAVEKELLKEVPLAATTSEGTAGKATPDKTEKTVTATEAAAAVGGAAVAVGGAAYAYLSGAASKLPAVPATVTANLPESVQKSINDINSNSKSSVAPTEVAKDTPEIVKESIAEAGKAPEAAGNEEAVLEKAAVEKELLKEIKPETSTGEPAPKITDAAKTSTPEPKSTITATEPTPKPKTTEPTPKSAEKLAPATPSKEAESRDVSPGTIPGSHTNTQTSPVVTTGLNSNNVAPTTPSKSAATPATPATPSSSTAADSPSVTTAEKKKKNRASGFFGKLKSKISSKDKAKE